MQFKSQNAAQFAFWYKNLRICLGHKVPISLKKSEKERFCQRKTKYIFKGIKSTKNSSKVVLSDNSSRSAVQRLMLGSCRLIFERSHF